MDFEKYSRRRAIIDTETPDWIEQLIKSAQPKFLADFGCGDGSLLLALKELGHLSMVEKCWAIDGSRVRLNRLEEYWTPAQAQPFLCTLQTDVIRTTIETSTLDLLLTTQVIEHVEDQGKMIGEMARVLKVGGHLYLSTVFKNWYGWYFHRAPCGWALDPTHVREYKKDSELLVDLEAAGLSVLKQRKSLLFYPLIDPVLKRLSQWRPSAAARLARQIRVPILGYYNWEIVAKRI